MFLILLIIVSIVTVLLFRRLIKKEDINPFNLVAGVCLVISWLVIALWFTSRIEAWQITLNTPAANSASLPAWSRAIINSLREAVYLLPTTRLTLAVLYASPLLLIPLALAAMRRSQTTPILIFSALVNLFLFWALVLIDSGLPASFLNTSIQGIILLIAYLLSILVLILQRLLLARL